MLHRNLPRSRPKRNAAPVSRVTWKEKKIMSNAILPETEQIWKDLTWNVKVPEKDNFWIRITSNMMVPEKDKSEKNHNTCESFWIGTFLKRNHIIYDSSCQRKEVLETCHVAWQLQPQTTVPLVYCLNIFELQIFFHFVLCGLRHAMSICRYVDMIRCGDSHCSESQAPGQHSFHRNLLAVLRYGKEQCDWNSRVHHSSS